MHKYNTRQARKGDLFLTRKDTLQDGLNSIRCRGAKLWNEIPVELRNSHSKASFKTKVQLQLLLYGNKDFPDDVNKIILQLTIDFNRKTGRFG